MSPLANEMRDRLLLGFKALWHSTVPICTAKFLYPNREFTFKLFAKSANSQPMYSPVLLGRRLLSTSQNSDKTCANNLTAYTIPNQSEAIPWPSLGCLYRRSLDFQISIVWKLCWEHMEFEETQPTKLDCKHFLLLSKGSYYWVSLQYDNGLHQTFTQL